MAVGITIIKSFPRHGVYGEEWSNKYHLTGPDPADATEWRTLFDNLVTEEKKLYSSATKVVRGYGYTDDGDDATAVWSVDLTVSPNVPVPGTFAPGSANPAPSDAACWVRWKLSRNNSNGKPIFLRKYYHDVWSMGGATPLEADTLVAAQKTVFNAFATLMFTGAGINAGRHIRDTGGGNPIAAGVSSYITTRTLKRRGKRP